MQLAKYLLETASKNYGTNSTNCQKAKTARNQMQYNSLLALVFYIKSYFFQKLQSFCFYEKQF
jgi:hypothetical protein